MPELPEVETVRRGLEGALVGAAFVRVEQRRQDLRFPFPERFAERLQGRRVAALDRRAKYILARLDGADVLAMHLGMTGRFTVENGADDARLGDFVHDLRPGAAHEHIVFHMSSGVRVRYADARRFGYMTLIPETDFERHKYFRALGPEPLSTAFDAGCLARAGAGRRRDIKAVLMDQRTLAGLGNIYVCEALHRARVSPSRVAATLATRAGRPTARAVALAAAVKTVLLGAIAAGGSTLRDYAHADGSLGYFQHSFAVYGRAGLSCARVGCGGTVERLTQAGRSTFFCPRCQR